ncbi:MAG TPA: hypothetical protein VGI74_26610, partial [Streptosporangiaceae bacterium]
VSLEESLENQIAPVTQIRHTTVRNSHRRRQLDESRGDAARTEPLGRQNSGKETRLNDDTAKQLLIGHGEACRAVLSGTR